MLNNSRRLLLLAAQGLQHDGLLRMALPQALCVCSTQLGANQSQQMQQQIQQQALLMPAALRLYASKAFRSKQTPSCKHKKRSLQQQTSVDRATAQQQHQPQRQQRRSPVSSSSSSRKGISESLPEPGPLVLPDVAAEQAAAAAAAAAPRFGRVPPSSAAAAAAAAAALNVQPGRKDSNAAAAASGAAGFTRHRKRSPQDAPTAAAADGSTAAAADDAEKPWPFPPLPTHLQPRQDVLPWEVVDALSQSSAFTLEKMAHGGIRSYMSYMRAARMGVPTVFDLGMVKEQGYLGRRHLLQRERVLELLLQQLQGSNNGGSSNSGGECETTPQQQQQQQQDVLTSAPWEPPDEQLQELAQEQVAAAAAAAAAEWNVGLLGDVTADYVAQCLVDYFVFKRCMEVLLYKRQYRLAIKARHQTLLEEYQQQQEQQQPDQQQQGSDVPVTLLSVSELSEVTVWDAFFDATYEDYLQYLIAAGKGHPSVFNTSRDHILDARNPPRAPQQQQQQHQDRSRQKAVRQYQQACQALTAEARVMHLFPGPMRKRPGHITSHQLLVAAVHGEVDPEAVVSVFEDFYECKRKAFRDALDEVLRAAGSSEAARNISRF